MVMLASPQRLAPPAFHVMVKPRGGVCNLGCAYCYYLSKTRLYPESAFRMDDALLEEFTRQYIAAQRVPEVTFGWQGGEPLLMGLPFFERAVELQRQHRPAAMRVLNGLQTNGTLLDEAWCRFFHQHGFLIGLSLDGPRAMHDAYRRDKGDGPTFERVMDGLRLLREHEVQFNILATVHAANANQPLEVYRFLRDEAGARFIQFIPIVERDNTTGYQEGERLTSRSVGGAQYGRFLSAIFDEWVRRDVGQVFVQTFDVALGAWMGEPPGLCVFSPTCGAALALEHNGDLYACDHYVEPRCLLGNILQTPLVELVGSVAQRSFGDAKQAALPALCRACPYLFACNGGCPKDRVQRTQPGEPSLNILCDGFRAFFAHADRTLRLMATELAAGRPAANVMLHLAGEERALVQQVARAGRNDPCPCGSGRKVKQCHGRSDAGVSASHAI
jgi:uncharacterized protein